LYGQRSLAYRRAAGVRVGGRQNQRAAAVLRQAAAADDPRVSLAGKAGDVPLLTGEPSGFQLAGVFQLLFAPPLRDGRYRPRSRTAWSDFRDRYEQEKGASLAENSLSATITSFNHVERI
jgi:hypothetical protein